MCGVYVYNGEHTRAVSVYICTVFFFKKKREKIEQEDRVEMNGRLNWARSM